MDHNYKQLFEASEHRCNIQEKLIVNQEKQISNLTLINSRLSSDLEKLTCRYDELTASYNHACEVCVEQQNLLDSIFYSKKS